MTDASNICIFAGSSEGRLPAYARAAHELGVEIASRGYGVVYGGASVGLMNAAAEGALQSGGRVIGILPKSNRAHGGRPSGIDGVAHCRVDA